MARENDSSIMVPSFPDWLRLLCSIALIVGALSSLVIVLDVFRRPQPMSIMNVVWPVTALFGTVLTLVFYFRYGRGPTKRPITSKAKPASSAPAPPFSVSVATSTLHCGSGCTLGDLAAEWLAFFAPNVAIAFGWHSLFNRETYAVWCLDFMVALVIGVVFQYLAIVPMRKLSPGDGVIAAMKADVMSLVAWQIGMYCVMAVFQFGVFQRHFGGVAPVDSTEFWASMQLAMLAGFITSYPINWWLIRAGIKETM